MQRKKVNQEGPLFRKNLQSDFWRLAKLNESLLYQKFRSRWVKEGDANTRYFHSIIKWRRKKNSLVGLFDNGTWVVEPVVVKEHVHDFFKCRFEKDTWMAPRMDGVPFSQQSSADNDFLTARFDMEEIREVVWDCEGDKSLSPDGFNFKFIKSFWYLLQQDVKILMDDFHANGVWPRGCNASFLAVVSKKESPISLNDFRPIS
ncbi:uncharacterized protein LOC130712900 [Lotus japonicus]|uniref:uncharacterized protein LOC130712900 n=1 Tax=Lotus japonicus TaxID=34305 RepID=UPI00258DAA1E|nr:uncharacterized protein LOC130712900 [Lotus japonicus]